MPAVQANGLEKRYGSVSALAGFDFTFPEGALVGFLGPNGAGKTTTFRTLLGLAKPDAGSAQIFGLDVRTNTNAIVKRVGSVVEEPGMYGTLSGRDNLRVAALTLGTGLDQIEELLDFVGLSNRADDKVAGYSKGMRQRLALAAALLGDPDLLLLDEPLDGLDPAGQVTVRERLRSLVDDAGKTVVVSSHVLSDVEQMADYLVVIRAGVAIVEGPMDELVAGSALRLEVHDPDKAMRALSAAGIKSRIDGSLLFVTGAEGNQVSKTLLEAGVFPDALIPMKVSLEEVFLGLTGDES